MEDVVVWAVGRRRTGAKVLLAARVIDARIDAALPVAKPCGSSGDVVGDPVREGPARRVRVVEHERE